MRTQHYVLLACALALQACASPRGHYDDHRGHYSREEERRIQYEERRRTHGMVPPHVREPGIRRHLQTNQYSQQYTGNQQAELPLGPNAQWYKDQGCVQIQDQRKTPPRKPGSSFATHSRWNCPFPPGAAPNVRVDVQTSVHHSQTEVFHQEPLPPADCRIDYSYTGTKYPYSYKRKPHNLQEFEDAVRGRRNDVLRVGSDELVCQIGAALGFDQFGTADLLYEYANSFEVVACTEELVRDYYVTYTDKSGSRFGLYRRSCYAGEQIIVLKLRTGELVPVQSLECGNLYVRRKS